MRIPGLKSLKQAACWLRSRFVGGALILGYHRIAESVRDVYSACVTPQHFSEQLEVLSRYGRVISLRELGSALQEGNVPERAVVLTFDDGYADLLHHAKPLLERYQMPATVFVATGSLGCEFWWDKLERVLLASAMLPEQLVLRIRNGNYEWMSGASRQHYEPGLEWRLIRSIYRTLLPLSAAEREQAMAQLCVEFKTPPNDRPSRRALTGDELIELATGDLVDIGAHTVTHPVLAGLSIATQRAEIQESKAHLEKILGRPVTSFAYPNGSSSQETLAIVRQSGFSCACASYSDVARRGSDRFHLPRFWIPDRDGEVFSRWLRLWLSA